MPERVKLCFTSNFELIVLSFMHMSTVFIICNWICSNGPNQRQMRMAKEGWGLQHLRFPGEQNSHQER